MFGPDYDRCPYDGSRLVNLGAGLAPGTVIDDRYTISRILGKGGMGSVYVARQHSMDREVAIKIMHHRADGNHLSVQRFFWEVRAARRLESPHTITVFDFGQTERGSLYLVMELLKGTTLGHLLGVEQRVQPHLALRIGVQMCRSLEEAHGKNIIHRDLKPENIFLVSRNGQRDFVKVLDFGVAKFLDPDAGGQLTQTGTVFGTPRYMSPEQANSQPVDPRSDLYALGIMLYEMLTGKVPFDDDNPLELLYKQVHESPTPVAEVDTGVEIDPKLSALIDRLLEKRKEDRFQSAISVREALEELLDQMSADDPTLRRVPGTPSPAPERPQQDTQQALGERAEAFPTPPMGLRTVHEAASTQFPQMLARPREAANAQKVIDSAFSLQRGRFIWVAGERGVGKGRLVKWLLRHAQRSHKAQVSRGYSSNSPGGEMPAIRGAIEHMLGVAILERPQVREHLAAHPAFSEQVEPDIINALTDFLRPSLDPGRRPVATPLLFAALQRLLVRFSKQRPVVLDLGVTSGADERTIRFLEHLAGTLASTPARICVMLSIETRGIAKHAGLAGILQKVGWRGEPERDTHELVPLGRLGKSEFKKFLRVLGKVYTQISDYLHYLSGGNPSVAERLVRQMESDPDRFREARLWNPLSERAQLSALPGELVDQTERTLTTALEAMPNPKLSREILRRAALIGYSFDLDLVEGCLAREGRDDMLDALEDTVDDLIDAAMLHETNDGRNLQFDNGLLREIVIGRIRSRRALKKLHGVIAVEIASRADETSTAEHSEALAVHFEASDNIAAALEYRMLQGNEALQNDATEVALQAFTKALDLSRTLTAAGAGDEADTAAEAEPQILTQLAQLHYDLGLFEQAAESYAALFQRAIEDEDEAGVAHAERGLAEVQDALAEYGTAAEMFRVARDRFLGLGLEVHAAWCELKRATSLESRGAIDDALAGYQAARRTFTQKRDRAGLAETYTRLGMLALAQKEHGEALRQLRRAVDLYKKLGEGRALAKGQYNLAVAALARSDYKFALDSANNALEIFDRFDDRTGVSQALGAIAKALMAQGRRIEARPYLERALRIREDLGDRHGIASSVAALARVALAMDQPDQAVELAFRARDIFGSCGDFLGAAGTLKTMGSAQSALGRLDDAITFLREAVATYDSLGVSDKDLCDILMTLSECERRSGQPGFAQQSLARAQDIATRGEMVEELRIIEGRLGA